MNWFSRFCRDAGLMVHNIMKPDKHRSQRQEVARNTEEKKLNDKVTLRRTTIDEIEVTRDDST